MRHPQSTKPMQKGRPRAKGKFKTHAELRQAIEERSHYKISQLAYHMQIQWRTAKRIVEEIRAEKRTD